MGIPCKDGAFSAFLSSVSSCSPHYSSLGNFRLHLSCVLWAWLLCTKEQTFKYHRLPACLPASLPLAHDTLIGISSQAEPILRAMSWSSCHLVRSLYKPESDSRGNGVEVPSGLDIDPCPWLFSGSSSCYVIIFPANVNIQLFSYNFKSAFPNQLPPTKAFFYGNIGATGDSGNRKMSGRACYTFLMRTCLTISHSFIHATHSFY